MIFFDLPNEMLDRILDFCKVEDMKNLACCSSASKDWLEENLWSDIRVSWSALVNIDWNRIEGKRRLKKFINTKSLCIYDRAPPKFKFKRSCYYPQVKRKHTAIFKEIVLNCSARGLENLHIHRHASAVEFACQVTMGLRKLDIQNIKDLTPGTYSAISKLRLLSELNLKYTNTTDAGLHLLSNGLKNLVKLNLASCNVTARGIAFIEILSTLRELFLNCCYLTDSSLLHIIKLSRLEVLDISDTQVTDKGFEQIEKLQYLKKLSVGGLRGITDSSMANISKLNLLSQLNVSRTNISDDGILKLSMLKNLKELEIFSCLLITDVGMSYVSRIETLELIDITYNSITNIGLGRLASLPKLKTLQCSYTKITDDALRPLDERMDIEWAP